MMSILKKATLAVATAGMLAISPISISSESTVRADDGNGAVREVQWRSRGWRGNRWRPYYYQPYYPNYYRPRYYQPYTNWYVPWYDVYRVPGVGRW
jgi:hypothetical protein